MSGGKAKNVSACAGTWGCSADVQESANGELLVVHMRDFWIVSGDGFCCDSVQDAEVPDWALAMLFDAAKAAYCQQTRCAEVAS